MIPSRQEGMSLEGKLFVVVIVLLMLGVCTPPV